MPSTIHNMPCRLVGPAVIDRARSMALAALVFLGCLLGAAAPAWSQGRSSANEPAEIGGPIRLVQPSTLNREEPRDRDTAPGDAGRAGRAPTISPGPIGNDAPVPTATDANPRPPSGAEEFEAYVRRAAGNVRIPRLGSTLLAPTGGLVDVNPQVPPDYLVQPGDEIHLAIWGSVDADLKLLVDGSGRVTVPRVGSVMVAGSRYGDLPATISQRVGMVFKNFQLSATLGRLRGQRVYVTGFVGRPGSYNVSSLATILGAVVAAGGPTAAGSYRAIQLLRGGNLVASFDLYDLLLKGDRSKDRVLQPEDVVFVGPVGVQVGVIGSVNRPAIVEVRADETVADAIRMTGGLTAVADTTRLAIERLEERVSLRLTELRLPADASLRLRNGDVVRAFNSVAAALPIQNQNRRIIVEGEVARPGEYIVPAHTTLMDAIRLAGGFTASAFVFGTDLTRESVRATQQVNYDRALRDLELDVTRSIYTERTSNAEEAAAQSGRQNAATRIVERLRQVRPTGRVVLQLQVDSTTLPELTVEDGDRISIPPRPTSVGIFGSVFNAGNYLFEPGRKMEDYLRLAGGPTKGADNGSVFVVRANGTVVSRRQSDGEQSWWKSGNKFYGVGTLPGDTIYVPEEFDKSTFVQSAKDWTQVLYQLGLGAAGLKALGLF